MTSDCPYHLQPKKTETGLKTEGQVGRRSIEHRKNEEEKNGITCNPFVRHSSPSPYRHPPSLLLVFSLPQEPISF
jgi:hypothetical protein